MDDEGLERFCLEAYPNLVAALTHHFGDLHLAEQLAQEALMAAVPRWKTVQHLGSPVGWCYRVGVNRGRSWFRHLRVQQRAQDRSMRGVTQVHTDPDGADKLAVRSALERLTDPQRQAIILRYFLDQSVEEAAAAMGTTPGALRALTHRALSSLRDVFDVDAEHRAEEERRVT